MSESQPQDPGGVLIGLMHPGNPAMPQQFPPKQVEVVSTNVVGDHKFTLLRAEEGRRIGVYLGNRSYDHFAKVSLRLNGQADWSTVFLGPRAESYPEMTDIFFGINASTGILKIEFEVFRAQPLYERPKNDPQNDAPLTGRSTMLIIGRDVLPNLIDRMLLQ